MIDDPLERGGFLFGGRIVVKIGRVVARELNVRQTDTQNSVYVTDWRFLIRETRKIDPKLINEFKVKAREIGKPVEDAIQRGIPSRFPITGMEPKTKPGRLTWGAYVPAKATDLKVDTRIRKKGKSIVSVWVQSPATAVADMAAKRGRNGRKTREYPYSRSATGYRRHTVNGQGIGMISALDKAPGMKSRKPSRFLWPSALASMSAVNNKMYQLIEKTSRQINAEIRTGAK